MAAIAKNGTPSLASVKPGPNEQIPGLRAGEDIKGGDLCTIKADGLAYKRRAGETVRGVAFVDAQSGEAVSIYRNVRFGYGSGLTPGADVFASGTVPGGLDTVGEAEPVKVGFAVDAQRIQFTGF